MPAPIAAPALFMSLRTQSTLWPQPLRHESSSWAQGYCQALPSSGDRAGYQVSSMQRHCWGTEEGTNVRDHETQQQLEHVQFHALPALQIAVDLQWCPFCNLLAVVVPGTTPALGSNAACARCLADPSRIRSESAHTGCAIDHETEQLVNLAVSTRISTPYRSCWTMLKRKTFIGQVHVEEKSTCEAINKLAAASNRGESSQLRRLPRIVAVRGTEHTCIVWWVRWPHEMRRLMCRGLMSLPATHLQL